MEAPYPPLPGAATFTKRCTGCGAETLHFRHVDDRSDELGRGSGPVPRDVYEVCTECQHTTDVTRG